MCVLIISQDKSYQTSDDDISQVLDLTAATKMHQVPSNFNSTTRTDTCKPIKQIFTAEISEAKIIQRRETANKLNFT